MRIFSAEDLQVLRDSVKALLEPAEAGVKCFMTSENGPSASRFCLGNLVDMIYGHREILTDRIGRT